MLWGGRLWRHPDFLKLWGGQTISQVGSQLTVLALPTVAVLQLHRGAFEVGILIALQRIPFPLLALLAGVWVDRVHRRPLMIAADVLRALALASVPIAALANALTLLQLYAVALLMGVGSVLFDVAYLAYLPSLVGPADLVEGNTKLEITFSVAGLAGPGLGGLLIQLVGAMLSASAVRLVGLGRLMAGCLAMAGVAFLLLPTAGVLPPALVFFAVFGTVGLFDTMFNINQVSLRQGITPNRLQGRMNASFRTIFWGAWPLANLIGGVLGSSIGPIPTILLGGSVGLLSAVAIALGPIGRLRQHPSAAPVR